MYSIIRSICYFTIACLLSATCRADINASLSLLKAVQNQPQPALAPTAVLDMMSLLYYGSASGSERQLSALFGGASREDVADAAAKAQRALPGYSRIGSVWFAERVQVTNDYYQAIRNQWKFHVSIAPLRSNPQEAAQDVNFWYSRQTRGFFDDVIQPGDLDGQPDMLAVIATAFISAWKTPLNPDETRDVVFYRSSRENFAVKMMKNVAKYPCHEDELFKALSMPMEVNDFQMIFLLPRDARAFKESFDQVDGDYLEKTLKKLKPRLVTLQLPRVDFKANRNWRNIFASSKISAPFTKGQGNFARINDNKPEALYIAKLIEEIAIKWDETGVLARSAAGAKADPVAGKPQAEFEFNANHPFVFIIYHKKEKDIALAGVIESPDQMEVAGR